MSMSKLILISSENAFANEIHLTEEMMELDKNLRFHLRKNRWSKEDYLEYLMEINPLFYPRISIHEFHDLQLNFPKIGLHSKEVDREDFVKSTSLNSTSFHSKRNALELGNEFDYFFCSPVFQSISKKNYSSDEKWDINNWETVLQNKAVALGGINSETIIAAKELGFTKFALLGNVWMSKNPLEAFKEILEICQK
jgi:thiamine-phosphate pyrophosphorylase